MANADQNLFFLNRADAGQKLAGALGKYRGPDTVILGLTRGGVPVGIEVARALGCGFEPLIVRKIGHPRQPEYAIGAISSSGQMVVNQAELQSLDPQWFKQESEKQQKEAERRLGIFLGRRQPADLAGKIAIIVDDGIATGLSMKAAIKEAQTRRPQTLVVAAPVAPADTVAAIGRLADECVVLSAPQHVLGAVGAYYEDFREITDDDVLDILKNEKTHQT